VGHGGARRLAAWDPRRRSDLDLDRAKTARYVQEKDHASAAARALLSKLRNPAVVVDADVRSFVEGQFAHFELWVEGLVLAAKVCLYSRWLLQTNDPVGRDDLSSLSTALAQLDAYASRARAVVEDSRVPHQVGMLVDHRRALDVVREGREAERKLRRASNLRNGRPGTLKSRIRVGVPPRDAQSRPTIRYAMPAAAQVMITALVPHGYSMPRIFLALLLVMVTGQGIAAEAVKASAPPDRYLWLEDVTGEKALDWARARNADSAKALETREFAALEKRILGILDSDARIPYVAKIGPSYYNFWKTRRIRAGSGAGPR